MALKSKVNSIANIKAREENSDESGLYEASGLKEADAKIKVVKESKPKAEKASKKG